MAAVGSLSARDLRIASRAVMRGPVPLDPDIRASAAQLARLQLKQYSGKSLWLGAIGMGAFAILSGVIALQESPWWWIITAGIFAFLLLTALEPRRLRRRIESLSREEPSHPERSREPRGGPAARTRRDFEPPLVDALEVLLEPAVAPAPLGDRGLKC